MLPAPTVPDSNGNRIAEEGLDRCACGSKYWNDDRCIDCGSPVTMRGKAREFTLYAGIYFGMPHRPNANPILDAMRDDDLAGDPWGTAMAWAFGVCDYLHHVALADDAIPQSLGYRSAATVVGEGFEEDNYPDAYIAEMAVDTYTLSVAARVLSRYLDWCKAAGRDY